MPPEWVDPWIHARQKLSIRYTRSNSLLGPVDTKDKFTLEPILAVLPTGHVLVGGGVGAKELAVIGRAQLQVGELGYVLWRYGTPVGVMKHRWRKAEFHPIFPIGGTIVEVLFFATNPETGLLDVYFRNDQQVTPLNLSDLIGASPNEVKWGVGTDAFFVRRDSTRYLIFQLNHEPHVPLGETPAEATFVRESRPWDTEPTLITVTLQADFTGERYTGRWEVTNTGVGVPPTSSQLVTASYTQSFVAGPVLEIDKHINTTIPIQLTQALMAAFGSISISETHLLEDLSLVAVCAVNPGLCLDALGVRTQAFTGTDQILEPISYFKTTFDGATTEETGSPSACDDPPSTINQASTWTFDVPETHLVVVNLTDNTVIWKTALDGAIPVENVLKELGGFSFSDAQSLTDWPDIGGAAAHDYTTDSCGTVPLEHTGLEPSAGDDPLSDLEFTGEDTTSIFIDTMLDESRIPVLTRAELYDSGVGAPVTLWAGDGTNGDSRPDALFASTPTLVTLVSEFRLLYRMKLTKTTSGIDREKFFTFGGWYIPRLDGAPGIVLIQLVTERFVSPVQTQIAFMAADAQTGVTTTLMSLTTVSGFGSSGGVFSPNIVVLGANLTHVLWRRVIRVSPAPVTDEIFLTNLRTNTTILVSSDGLTFIARHWHILRPDFLYLRDETDEDKGNKFIEAWDAEDVPTFDSTTADFPIVDEILNDVAVLKELDTIAPDETSPGPSVQALNNSDILTPLGKFEEDT